MHIFDYNFELPPNYVTLRKKDEIIWRNILEFIYRIDHPSIFDKKIKLKNEKAKLIWIRNELNIMFESIRSILNNYSRHKYYSIDDILPYLLESNRDRLDQKWLFYVIQCYLDFGSQEFIEGKNQSFGPQNLSNNILTKLNEVGNSDTLFEYEGNILRENDHIHNSNLSTDRYFPHYELPFDDLMEIEFSPASTIDKRFQVLEVEWKTLCRHLNENIDNQAEIAFLLEDAFRSFEIYYGSNRLERWVKQFQYFLTHYPLIDSAIIPIIRSWLNNLVEYKIQTEGYLQSNIDIIPESDYMTLDYQLYFADKKETIYWFDVFSKPPKSANTFSALEEALLIFLRAETHELKIEGNKYDAIEKLGTNNSHKSVTNKYNKILKYYQGVKTSGINSEDLNKGLEKIINSNPSKEIVSRSKNLLIFKQ